MNRRSMLLGSTIAFVAPLLPAWAKPRQPDIEPLCNMPVPSPLAHRAGLAPRYAGINAPWAEDCLRWRGRVLTGERAHWCWDWDGLPVDETTPEHASCSCVWAHQPIEPVFKPRRL